MPENPEAAPKAEANPYLFMFMFVLEFSVSMFVIFLGKSFLEGTTDALSSGSRIDLYLGVVASALLCLSFGSCCYLFQPKCGIIKFTCCTIPLFVALGGLGVFALTVSRKGGGKPIPGTSYRTYDIDSYSQWMQKDFKNTSDRWDEYYRKVVFDDQVCANFFLGYANDSLDQFRRRDLSPYESGCCKPPEDCNFDYTSPATWMKPAKEANYSNNDCGKWSNDPKILCLDCQSCKAAVLQDMKRQLFRTGIFLVYLSGTLLCLLSCTITCYRCSKWLST